MRKFIAWLSSVRLAIGLIAYLSVTCVLATLIPQGLSEAEYLALYPRLIAELIVQTGLWRFFSSIAFILPSFLFIANLSVCTVKRFLRELGKKGSRRFGPDILHAGILALAIGAIWSYSGHQEGSVMLGPGERVNLPDGSVLTLRDFRFERYPDGRPREWASIVDIAKDGKAVREAIEIRVNAPLRYEGLTLYQASYSEAGALFLRNETGREFRIAQGEEISLDGLSLFFMAMEEAAPGRAILRVASAEGDAVVRVAAGEAVGGATVLGYRTELLTGLEAVSDPGYPLVFAALLMIALGTAVTFIQKLKETA